MLFVIVEDHPLVRSSIATLLSDNFKGAGRIECGSAEETAMYLKKRQPDLILSDLSLPGVSGVEAIKALLDYQPNTPILILSASDNPHEMQRCLDAGARGFVNKSESSAVIVTAIQTILLGESYIPVVLRTQTSLITQRLNSVKTITSRQMDVLRLMREGKRNKEIANGLKVSEATIKVHCRDLFQCLGVNSRHSAVEEALRLGLLH